LKYLSRKGFFPIHNLDQIVPFKKDPKSKFPYWKVLAVEFNNMADISCGVVHLEILTGRRYWAHNL